jgi:hypothetical protein
VALDGAEALLLDQTPDAISLALMLPAGKGVEVAGSRSSEATYAPQHKSSELQLDLASNQHYVREVFDALPRTAPLQWLPSDYVNHIVTPFDIGHSGTFRDEKELLIYKGAIVNVQMQEERGLVDVFIRIAEVKGVRSSLTDVGHTTWDEASRTANTMCFNRGFITGHFDGYQDGWDWGDNSMSFGVLCSGPGVQWRDVTSADIARTNSPFTDVGQVHWAQANRAAAGLCTGYAGGRFNGYQKGDMHGLVCYSNDMATWFDATTQVLERLGHSIDDLNNTPWEVAARAARDFCRTRGDLYKTYQGGFFNGHQAGNKRGIVCLRTTAICRYCARANNPIRVGP